MKQFQLNTFVLAVGAILLLTGFVSAEDSSETKKPKQPQAEQTVLTIQDHAWDGGDELDIRVKLSPEVFDSVTGDQASGELTLLQSEEFRGVYKQISKLPPNDGSWELDAENHAVSIQIGDLNRETEYFYRVYWQPQDGEKQLLTENTVAISPERQWFSGEKWKLALVGIMICGSVILFIELAKRGWKLKVRRIAGLEAVDEAVGRATEMGRSVLFVPGIQDMNDIQTIAGLNILSHVARTAAEYDAKVEVPTSKALVMTAARDTLQGAFMAAGRPDAYNPDLAYYVTDEQFGYVAYVSGTMVREKPAACFYLGAFFAESLILAETGNSIGAIQIAGTAQPSQLPFFVAACDYTLIGEELFAASAYLSGSPEELGSLKGQDVGKIIVAVWLLAGCAIATLSVWGISLEMWY